MIGDDAFEETQAETVSRRYRGEGRRPREGGQPTAHPR